MKTPKAHKDFCNYRLPFKQQSQATFLWKSWLHFSKTADRLDYNNETANNRADAAWSAFEDYLTALEPESLSA